MKYHPYSPHCGCGHCDRAEDAIERREEDIAEMLADPQWRAAHERQAESFSCSTLDEDHYTDVTLALDALHREGATVAVLERLHRLAKTASMALNAALRDVAEADYDRERAA